MDEYGITSFGVSVTTLEEVFMKVGEGAERTVDDLYVLQIIAHLFLRLFQFVTHSRIASFPTLVMYCPIIQ